MDPKVKKAAKEVLSEMVSEAKKDLAIITQNHYPATFTGEVYTLVYKPHNGFANYSIATLTIENGQVKKVQLSDPYAGFEAAARLDILTKKALEKLRTGYPTGYQTHV